MSKRLSLLLACLFLSLGMALAQTKVSGTVVDDNGDPAIGATVKVEGTTGGGTITDINGKFTISVPSGKKIIITYIGMQPQTVTPRNGMTINMKADNQTLGEVVVTGMQKVDKRLFTGSSTKVNAADAKIDGVADISRSLEGRAAGVTVQNVTGTFGTAPKIRVRGATSIYGSSKPLWVVDGVIMEDVVDVDADDLSSGDANTLISSAIAGLNADDIESFQILKDGSATSIYGARAMAGVIVVTTKRGKAGQAQINYTGEFTMRLKPSYSNFNIMNSQDQMSVYQEMEQKGWLGYANVANASDSGVYGKMYNMLSEYDPVTHQYALDNTPEAKAAYLRDAEYRNTDWFDELFKNSVMQNHSVSISSGTDRSQTYASVSAMYDPGWTLQSKVQRYTANINTGYDISRKVNVNVIANASYRKQRAPGTLSASVNQVSGEVTRDFDINPYSYALNSSRTLDPNTYYTRNYAPFNIKHELANNYMDLDVFDFRSQFRLTYKPISKVELIGLWAVKYSSTSQEHNILDDSNQAQAYRAMPNSIIRDDNPWLYSDPDNPYALPITVLPNGGILERTDNKMFGWDMRYSVSYNDVFNNDHIVNFYGGLETNSYDRRSTWFRGWGMQYSLGEIPNYAYQVFKKGQEDGTDYFSLSNRHTRSAAFFANATYSWKGRYTINGTFRYEGTNGLGKATSSRWMPTWNVSGAWNAHEETWFEKLRPALSHLTLKLSYSLTGDRPSVSNALAIIRATTPWRYFTRDSESGLYISSVANPDLTYEKKHEWNFGLEAGFLNNRINYTMDIYSRRNYDLIGIANADGVDGWVTKTGNIAKMKSNGIEISLSTTNIKNKDFSWTTSFIYSHTHNEVTDLQTQSRLISFVRGNGFARTGYPVRALFSIPFLGLNSQGLPTFLNSDGTVTTTGINFQLADQGDNLNFLKYEGPTDPTDTGSFGNIFKWKGLTLNVFITYSFGNKVRLDPVFKYRYTDLTATPKEFVNRWEVPGDELKTDIPVIATREMAYDDSNLARAYNAYNYSTARIAKGDFIRMKEISLSYDFPKAIYTAVGMTKLSLKIQATNLFLIYADKKLNGQDPEFFNSGGVATPNPKQFTMTLRLGF